MDTLLLNGPLDRRMNIILVAEGYRAEEIPVFREDCKRVAEKIFAASPFKEYKSYFNVLTVAVASKESGADNPAFGIVRDSYFNTAYSSCGICPRANEQGNVVWSDFKWELYEKMGYLDPLWMMLVNDDTSGGTSEVTARGTNDFLPVVHELGHQFANLADEYLQNRSAFEAPNITAKTSRDEVKWRHWIDPTTPLPTPATAQYSNVVGLFEGAIQEKGWYRPQQQCKMLASEYAFCAVCREHIISYIYQDERWSNRMTRLRKFLPASAVVTMPLSSSLPFSLDAPQPAHGLKVEWFVDGTLVNTGDKELTVSAAALGVGEHTVELRVKDETPFVRSPIILPDLTKTRTWRVTVSQPLSSRAELATDKVSLAQNYPNPVYANTSFTFNLIKPAAVRLTVHDLVGREVATVVAGTFDSGRQEVKWQAPNLPAGLYLYRLQVGSTSITKRLILQK
ncbi:M64 family metallopeptidase [Hymenobacter lutimineralis]|nr:M64 family metallopeptidase [Hymenobacter lutimineralis]